MSRWVRRLSARHQRVYVKAFTSCFNSWRSLVIHIENMRALRSRSDSGQQAIAGQAVPILIQAEDIAKPQVGAVFKAALRLALA